MKNRKIANKLAVFLLSVFSVLALMSCGDSEVDADLDRAEQVNTLTYVVKCNNPTAHVQLYTHDKTIIMGSWTKTYKTKSYFTECSAECIDDPLATVTIELFRNGKLYAKKSAIGAAAEVSCRIKGRGL